MSNAIVNIQTNLTREQGQAVSILSIGTFLEYFDLMLYVHMAVLLNELFFPTSDAFTASLVSTFAFCSTYLMRPIGAVIFGYIGDNIGRTFTVVITTAMMALSSLSIFFLPTYAQIGITASWLMIILRMIQGLSAMGEIIGAELYLTELIKPPKQYFAVAFIVFMSSVGTFAALGMSFIILQYNINWRYAFLIGACIALVGMMARTSLREAPEFLVSKRDQLVRKMLNINSRKKNTLPTVSNRVIYSFLFMESANPIWIYMTYIYYGMFLKQNFGYSSVDVIQHNFYIATLGVVAGAVILFLVNKMHPLKIMKIRVCVFTAGLPFFLWMLDNNVTIFNVIIFQIFVKIFNPTNTPGQAILFKHFPILRRFTMVSLLNAISRVAMYCCTAFAMLYLTKYFGTYGLLIIIVPILLGYFYGLNTFITLEREAGNYGKKEF
ncbi:MAG: MFS transporter [Rickettsiaceae bacterium]